MKLSKPIHRTSEDAIDYEGELLDLIARLANRIYLAHEVIGNRAERREWILTESDYPTE